MKRDLEILRAFRSGQYDEETAAALLRQARFADLGHTRVDLEREGRTGCAEVIFGENKTAEEIADIMRELVRDTGRALATRVSPDKARVVLASMPEAVYDARARLLRVGNLHASGAESAEPYVVVISAGTSDAPVAEEAALTLEFLGTPVRRRFDCGVAGLHRLLAELDVLRGAAAVVAVAGMEGALPSVVAGLVACPVIAVPTSVGYGASFGGVTALLAMLNACASGVSVVNIDNGFGGGFNAHLIARAHSATQKTRAAAPSGIEGPPWPP